ncbi:hypothetical protein LEAN103870_06470 [Legionella anisa]|uniref:Lipoprotein n=1 Tax=Legionella anisa TaxID=28082 RepID=A0AAX0WQG4_9GAMM|nr:hypothetical protein [Legionella anisa]AWN75535.1 hypothetical protein DLD14_17780 [Legionella anisa]KTC76322.1 hypothetical protein Lani_0395 [Legionella anisa]MBN5937136.1 hypothetical protein [Legionella anisa]MCW8424274.1 hypothetical protein [Legionella anisa]MCW8446608.1 hypothetical protein [Legionella anisa]
MSKSMMMLFLLVFTSCNHANIANDILLSRTSAQKTQILSGIINAAGESCAPIESFYQGVDRNDAAYWNILCLNGRSYVIQIANDAEATTTIFPCSAMKSLGAQCFKQFGF